MWGVASLSELSSSPASWCLLPDVALESTVATTAQTAWLLPWVGSASSLSLVSPAFLYVRERFVNAAFVGGSRRRWCGLNLKDRSPPKDTETLWAPEAEMVVLFTVPTLPVKCGTVR